MAEKQSSTTPALPVKGQPLEAHIISPPVPPSEMSDADLGREAAASVDRALSLKENSLEQARRAGELLLEANHRCQDRGHSFKHWLREFWPKSRTTALAYMRIAQEVQQDSGRRADLLGCQSIRAFLTDRGFGAGGTREQDDEDDTREAREAAERARLEQLSRDAARVPDPEDDSAEEPEPSRSPTWTPPPRRGGLVASAVTDPAEAARRAAEREAINEAESRNNLVEHEPQREEKKDETEEIDDGPTSCVGAVEEAKGKLDALVREAQLLLSDFNAIKVWGAKPGDERVALKREIGAALAAAVEGLSSVSKKRAGQFAQFVAADARVVGAAKEAEAKAAASAAKKRRGA